MYIYLSFTERELRNRTAGSGGAAEAGRAWPEVPAVSRASEEGERRPLSRAVVWFSFARDFPRVAGVKSESAELLPMNFVRVFLTGVGSRMLLSRAKEA